MNVSEIKTERLRILSLGREQANCEETVCFTPSELAKRKGDGDKRVVKYWKVVQPILSGSKQDTHAKTIDCEGVEVITADNRCMPLINCTLRIVTNDAFWKEITAAEYEAAKSTVPVAVAGAARLLDVCLDCGKVHEGECVNTNEAKEKPEQVGYRLLAGNEAIQHGDEFRCDCHIGCKDWQTTSLTKGSTVDVARAQFCKNFIYRRATPPANILPASEIKVLDEVCKIGQPTKPEPVVIGGHKWCSQCHQHHKNGTACPKAKQAEPWNTSVSHFLQLEQIRRRHDALEARHNEQDKIISSLCKKITELEAQ